MIYQYELGTEVLQGLIQGVIFTLFVLAIAFCIYMLIRNEQVFKHRNRIIGRIGELADQDIAAGRPWEWRYEAFGAVAYRDMHLKFWKSLDSFYQDKSFYGGWT